VTRARADVIKVTDEDVREVEREAARLGLSPSEAVARLVIKMVPDAARVVLDLEGGKITVYLRRRRRLN
jgi:hypothetical protein